MTPLSNIDSRLLGLALLLPQPVSLSAAENEPFTESVVVFNTVCAKCHEGECSGRLGLTRDYDAAVSHILRHYLQADGKPSLQKELFDILGYMKDHCAFYPMRAPPPPDRVWETGRLERLRTDPDGSYFVPLGTLSPGNYRLGLELERDVHATIQLISAEFDMVVEQSPGAADGRLDIPFAIETGGDYYFRMYPQPAARITRLAVMPAAPGTTSR